MPPERSTGTSQDEGEEEEEAHDDAHSEEEEDEFDSGDEEILTKSGWSKRTLD